VTLRSTAGRLDSPIGEVVAVASEHDQVAGTERHRADALPDRAHRLPRAFGRVPRALRRVERLPSSTFELEALPAGDTPLVVVPSAP
jgi:hypothetical protein